MKMTDEVFNECLSAWQVSTGNQAFWQELANRFEFGSVESIRSAFKRERQARGIVKVQNRTIQQNPVIGVMDFETLPLKIEGYLFGIRDQYITYDMVARDSRILSWAGKVLGDNRVFSDIMTPDEARNYDSHRITKSAKSFVDACDFIIGHNWKGFDGKVLNSELMFHRLAPVDYTAIDTLLLIRHYFREASYKLADINKKYGIRNKISNEGMNLWRRCANGDPDALAEMLFYNEGDILANEDLFYRIAPYVSRSLPNFDIYRSGMKRECVCGNNVFHSEGYMYTTGGKFSRLRCTCGAIYKGRKNLLTKEEKKLLTA
jgi:hypothetical protein